MSFDQWLIAILNAVAWPLAFYWAVRYFIDRSCETEDRGDD